MTELELMHRMRPGSLVGWSRYYQAVERDRKRKKGSR